MSVSVNLKGMPRKKISSGLQDHQERFDEKKARAISKNTASHIDVSETKYNKSMFKSELIKDVSVKKFVSSEFEKVNEKRQELGLRKYREDSNVLATGNFQISDDSLEKLGYDKSKKWSEQDEQARKNVIIVYGRLVNNAVRKPEIYGRVLTATLHVDESTPHVDFLSTALDKNQPEWSLREVLNGKEYRDENGNRRFPPKGSKLSQMQDDLNNAFKLEEQKTYGLHRGDVKSENYDYARKRRKVKKELDKTEKRLNERERKLDARENALDMRNSSLDARENALDVRKSSLDARENKILNNKTDALLNASEKLSDAHSKLLRLQQENDKLEQLKARKRAEIAQLDSIELNNIDKAVLNYMKTTKSPSTPGSMIFDVVNRNYQKSKDDALLRILSNAQSNLSSNQSSYDFDFNK